MDIKSLKNKKTIAIISGICGVFFVLTGSAYFLYQSNLQKIEDQILEKDQAISNLESQNKDLTKAVDDLEVVVESDSNDISTTIAAQPAHVAVAASTQSVPANRGTVGNVKSSEDIEEDRADMCESRIESQIEMLENRIDHFEEDIEDLEGDIEESDDDDDIADWEDDIEDLEEEIENLEEKIDDLEDDVEDC